MSLNESAKTAAPQLSNESRTKHKHRYLSVDLDFWLANSPDLAFLDRLINTVGSENVAAAVDHHSILAHVMRYRSCTELVNIDAHADIGGMTRNLQDENCDGCSIAWIFKG